MSLAIALGRIGLFVHIFSGMVYAAVCSITLIVVGHGHSIVYM